MFDSNIYLFPFSFIYFGGPADKGILVAYIDPKIIPHYNRSTVKQ